MKVKIEIKQKRYLVSISKCNFTAFEAEDRQYREINLIGGKNPQKCKFSEFSKQNHILTSKNNIFTHFE